ncbi:MAG: tetratricopeptide repeat protein [Deltaproteobacteria bacterium]|nr:tetratricopeptide repeat protein [Deltaproteobacteria bacterium]
MPSRSLPLATLFFLMFLSAWTSLGWAQPDIRFEQYSPQEERHWQEVLRRNPRDAQAHFHLGRYYEFVRRTPDAAKFYRQATLLNPGWAQPFFYLGKAYRELGRYQEAAAALQRAVTLKPDYARAYHYLGLVKINLRRYEEAADALVKAYTCDPGWAETYYDNTTYGIHNELGESKETVLALIKYIYPVNQHLARIVYKRWDRGGAAMKEYWETVSGRKLPADYGYQQGPIPGSQEPVEPGYQKPQDIGYQRRPNQPSAPEQLAD